VRAGDGVEVAGEVQIDGMRGPHGAFAAPGGTAFAAKDRSHRRLAQRERDTLPDFLQTLRETDGNGGFALTGRCRRDGGDENQLPPLRFVMESLETDLGHVTPMQNEVIRGNADAGGDGRDVRVHGRWKRA
jgi:hypothetical protein